MSDALERSAVVPASCETIFDAWIDGAGHAAMTGADASSEPEVGGRFTAWDGYIEGVHEILERPHRIVQRWRTVEFPEDAPDSRLELRFTTEGDGTRVHILHSEIPAGQGEQYEQGWHDHYLAPMVAHFGG
jgi:uncharacterized protein YndB with AHSA1/START domain